jgi:ubiquinone/menaquinone biosynthesis C-methylase UbiE
MSAPELKTAPPVPLNQEVRGFWEQAPCGTTAEIVGELPKLTREWFERVETHRYAVEPYIHSAAQFTRHHGKMILEVGVGAGTDHLQWARAGAICHGVDLTQAAIDTTRARLDMYGFKSQLTRLDAEQGLPYPDETFDLVYSWGVIHHSEKPETILAEIRRVLRPGGAFIGMMYGRHSLVAAKLWFKHGLFEGKPWLSFRHMLWNHVESVGTKGYTVRELKAMFSQFRSCAAEPIITVYDTRLFPKWISGMFPNRWGWFIILRAVR